MFALTELQLLPGVGLDHDDWCGDDNLVMTGARQSPFPPLPGLLSVLTKLLDWMFCPTIFTSPGSPPHQYFSQHKTKFPGLEVLSSPRYKYYEIFTAYNKMKKNYHHKHSNIWISRTVSVSTHRINVKRHTFFV